MGRQRQILHLLVVPAQWLNMVWTPRIAKINCVRIKVTSNHKHILNWRLLIDVGPVFPMWVLQLTHTINQLASTVDDGVTPVTIGHLHHQKSAVSHYIVTMQRILARRELNHNLQRADLGLWVTVALIELHILLEERQLGCWTNDWRVHKWA